MSRLSKQDIHEMVVSGKFRETFTSTDFTGKKKHGFYRCHTGNCPALSLAFQIKKRKNT